MRGFYHELKKQSLGVGVGLRARHVVEILKNKPSLDWFELLADNHMVDGGWARQQAIEIAQHYPITMHCVGMSIAASDPVDFTYLQKVKELATTIKPKLISDHLCWTTLKSQQSHDLLPFPFTDESLQHVVSRIDRIQDFLGERIAIENISSYLTYQHSSIEESQFINEVAHKADCHILLDLNNIYVNHYNNQQETYPYIDAIDLQRVAEIHLAGFEDKGNYYLDAHNNKVHDAVWDLYEYAMRIRNDIPTLIEWDHDIPDFSVLRAEAEKAIKIKRNIKTSTIQDQPL